MTVSEVRERYLDFFAKRGHAIIPSAPIVPENDPTTLFTSSGMQPLVPYLLGEPHPKGTRLANSQMSFRAEDIEEVGDNRHTTFFEMLGNWSFGDYFKREQLPWFYEFLTNRKEGLGLAPEKLYVTTFAGDEESGMAADAESAEIWKDIGIPEERIFSYGAKKNWWSRAGVPSKMPAGEIGGPDSEVFYDFGPSTSSGQARHTLEFGETCHPNCDCGRFVEIGNSVFMQFVKRADGSFGELPKKNVDFGGGLERLTAATRGDPDIFLVDIFDSARAVLEARSGKKYGDAGATRPFRIILDHIRAATFMLASDIRPGPNERNSVLRKLIRRAIVERRHLGIPHTVIAEVAKSFCDAYADTYPFVKNAETTITEELTKEESGFEKTLANAIKELWKLFYSIGEKVMTSDLLFRFDSEKGFAPEFTLEEYRRFLMEKQLPPLSEQNRSELLKEYQARMEEHQALSREGAAQKFAGGLADHAEQTVRYHTLHHILLKALQMVLGKDVHQRGSNITSERLRIDFSYGQKMTPEQKAEVERIVNEKIAERLPVVRTDMKKEEAEKLGAEHEFGAAYPDVVSVYSVGPLENAFSIEFCGGPHVANTADLAGTFKILKEEASSAGVRRIKAVLE